MKIAQCGAMLAVLSAVAGGMTNRAFGEDSPVAAAGTVTVGAGAAATTPATAAAPVAPAIIVREGSGEAPDPCRTGEVAANATRPAWDYAASTTQCGVIESDFGWLGQATGPGVNQQMVVSSIRYGLTPRLDLRWGLTNHIWQNGSGSESLQGTGDQWLGGRYRFQEQGRVIPAIAFLYAGRVPQANPAKGFGSGFADHQFVLIVSRDLGKYHFDFNTVGTLAGGAHGHDGAAQFGLALTRPVTKKLSGILESYGGGQPGTPDRFGAAFAGATFAVRPQLAIDAAYTRTYTAGSPREQVLFGITYARRAGFSPLSRRFAAARVLGR
jgi:hypothetical protein